jgi:hypothetical protein
VQNEHSILITGAARSGTSLVAGIVHLSGAYGGKLAGPNASNKKGMFENREIRNTISKPFLSSIGADKMGQKPLPDRALITTIAEMRAVEWQRRVMAILYNQGYQTGIFFYKGAKMCLTWPIWHAAFPDAHWIIVRRDDEGIIDSCMFTPFMRAYKDRKGWQEWIDEHKKCFAEMANAGLKMRTIWSNDIIKGHLEDIQGVIEWAGLKWDEKAVRKFVDPKLFHVKQGDQNG